MVHAVCKWSFGCIFFCLTVAAASLAASAPNLDSKVPTHTLKGHLMVVNVSVNNRGPFAFLVDTGTNTTLIDPQLGADLGLKPAGRIALANMNQATSVNRYFLETFRVGKASVSHLEVLAAPLAQLRALDPNIRGVVGMNFLLEFSFLLDYEQKRLELFPTPSAAPAPEGSRVRVEIHDGRILIPVATQVSPRGTWKLVLDSGIDQLLVFEERLAPAAKGSDRCLQGTCLMQVATNLSRQNALVLRVQEVRIGGVYLYDVLTVVLRNELLSPTDPGDGLLPACVFRSVFFDRGNASVVLNPRLAMVAGR